jgi:hypothetical protein
LVLKTGEGRFAGLGLKTRQGRFDGLGLKTIGGRFDRFGPKKSGSGGSTDTWWHLKACVEAKRCREDAGSVGSMPKNLNGFALSRYLG